MKQKTKQLCIFLIGVIAAIGFDQWTKYQAVLHLKAQPPFVLWNGVFEFFFGESWSCFWYSAGQTVFFLSGSGSSHTGHWLSDVSYACETSLSSSADLSWADSVQGP